MQQEKKLPDIQAFSASLQREDPAHEVSLLEHYELLMEEGNDPVLDPPELRSYMDGWDGDAFLDALKLTGAEDVLEIGVGTGRLAVRILSACREFVGIDLSGKTIARAREHLSNDPHAVLVEGDFLQHAFTRQFHVIYSSLTFMHIREKAEAIAKSALLLRPGGRLVLSLDKSRSEWLDMGTRRIRIYPDTPDQTSEYMRQAGLTVQPVIETPFAWIVSAQKTV